MVFWEIKGAKARPIKEFKKVGLIFGLEVSPCGQLLVLHRQLKSPTDDREDVLEVWDYTKGEKLYSLALPNVLYAWRLSPDGKRIAYLDEKSVIRVHEVSTGKKLVSWHIGTSPRSISFSPDGLNLATVTLEERSVRVWDSSTGKKVKELTPDCVAIHSVFRGNNTVVAAVHGPLPGHYSLMQWDILSGKVVARFHDYPREIYGLAVNPITGWLASGSGKDLLIWNLPDPHPLYRLKVACDFRGAMFSPDGRWLAAADMIPTAWAASVWEFVP